jgi:DNA mismatch endonuclease (patch repair protein)
VMRPRYGVPEASSPQVLARMVQQRRSDTKPELALRRELHRRGLRYRVHVRPFSDLRRTVDLVFPRSRIAVEVRGCFWHACPEHGDRPKANAAWWNAKLDRTRERDDHTAREFAQRGWTLLVVWEHEEVVAAADRVENAVRMSVNEGLAKVSKRVCPGLGH